MINHTVHMRKNMAKRTKLGWQLYNTRILLRKQMEKIRFIRDELSLDAIQQLNDCEQNLWKIESGLWNKKLQIVDDEETEKPNGV